MTRGHASFKYSSLYFGNRVAKLDSSVNAPAVLSAGVKGSCFHLSKVSSLSQGLSLLWVEGMMKRGEAEVTIAVLCFACASITVGFEDHATKPLR